MKRSLNNIFYRYQRSDSIDRKVFEENLKYILFDKLEKVILTEIETKNNKLIFNIKTKNNTLSIKTELRYSTEIYVINASKVPLIYNNPKEYIDDIIEKRDKELKLLETYEHSAKNKREQIKKLQNNINDIKNNYTEYML